MPLVRPPLSAAETETRERLVRHLGRLADRGERHPGKPWELADAADYVAGELEGLGYALERQGYDGDGVALQNLVVTVPGREEGDQVLLLGAHYDSPPGDPGRNAGGSGTAALLELARLLAGSSPTRTVRLAFFALGETPHGDGAARGARVYRDALEKRRAAATEALRADAEAKARGELPQSLPEPTVDRSRVVGAIFLERLLGFSAGARGGLQIVVGGSQNAGPLRAALSEALAEQPFEVTREGSDDVRDSDAQVWIELGTPTAVVHGEGTLAGADVDALARLVPRLRDAVRELALERPTAPDVLLAE